MKLAVFGRGGSQVSSVALIVVHAVARLRLLDETGGDCWVYSVFCPLLTYLGSLENCHSLMFGNPKIQALNMPDHNSSIENRAGTKGTNVVMDELRLGTVHT
jgi:hypothetical protein